MRSEFGRGGSRIDLFETTESVARRGRGEGERKYRRKKGMDLDCLLMGCRLVSAQPSTSIQPSLATASIRTWLRSSVVELFLMKLEGSRGMALGRLAPRPGQLGPIEGVPKQPRCAESSGTSPLGSPGSRLPPDWLFASDWIRIENHAGPRDLCNVIAARTASTRSHDFILAGQFCVACQVMRMFAGARRTRIQLRGC